MAAKALQSCPADPGFDLGGGGAPGGEHNHGSPLGNPARLNACQVPLPGIVENSEFQAALGGEETATAHRGFQPAPGGRIVVLGKEGKSPRRSGWSGRKVGAENKHVSLFHGPGDAVQQRQRIQVGKHPEKGEESRSGKPVQGGRKRAGQIDSEGRFSQAGQPPGGLEGEGEIGVGGKQMGWIREFAKEEGFLISAGTTKGDEGIGAGQFFQDGRGGLLIKKPDGRPMQEGGASEMNLFP